MSRAIDVEKAIEIIEAKQKELCPVGRYGRNYVYGSDREKYDAWEEIIDALDNLPTLTPPNEWVSVEDELPERDGVYLVVTTRGSVTTAHFYAEKTFSDGHRKSANWQGNRKVTYWMLLPAPPDRRPPEGEA